MSFICFIYIYCIVHALLYFHTQHTCPCNIRYSTRLAGYHLPLVGRVDCIKHSIQSLEGSKLVRTLRVFSRNIS